MKNLKKSIFFPFINWKFSLPVLLLLSLIIFHDVFLVISFFLVTLLVFGLIGTKISGGLTTYKESYESIFKFGIISFFVTIIFFIMQILALFLIILPFILVSINVLDILSLTLESPLYIVSIIFLVIAALLIFALEFFKMLGLINYYKTNNIEKLFEIKNFLKKIFTKNFLKLILFIAIIFFPYLLIYSLISTFLHVLFTKIFASISVILFFLFVYVFTATIFSAVDELFFNENRKTKSKIRKI